MPAPTRFPMELDRIVGDGGNLTIYERPDHSRYALDKRGHGVECDAGVPVFGRARFDARDKASGDWKDSRSDLRTVPPPATALNSGPRLRGRGGSHA